MSNKSDYGSKYESKPGHMEGEECSELDCTARRSDRSSWWKKCHSIALGITVFICQNSSKAAASTLNAG